jgi:2-dehydropantoate 2-reductase
MYQDLISKRKTEIEFLNGLIIKLGKAQKIPTPYNQQVYLRVKEQEKSNRNPI